MKIRETILTITALGADSSATSETLYIGDADSVLVYYENSVGIAPNEPSMRTYFGHDETDLATRGKLAFEILTGTGKQMLSLNRYTMQTSKTEVTCDWGEFLAIDIYNPAGNGNLTATVTLVACAQ